MDASTHTITVKATDTSGLSTTQNFTINGVHINQAPINIVDSNTNANSVAENSAVGTVVGVTATATDPDGDVLTYSLTDNAGGKFAIDANTGVVKVAGAIDFESAQSQSITVKAMDADGLSTTQTLNIGVTNANETPTSIADSNTATNTVAENAEVGTLVGITAKAADPDAGDTFTYSLVGNDGKFAASAPRKTSPLV